MREVFWKPKTLNSISVLYTAFITLLAFSEVFCLEFFLEIVLNSRRRCFFNSFTSSRYPCSRSESTLLNEMEKSLNSIAVSCQVDPSSLRSSSSESSLSLDGVHVSSEERDTFSSSTHAINSSSTPSWFTGDVVSLTGGVFEFGLARTPLFKLRRTVLWHGQDKGIDKFVLSQSLHQKWDGCQSKLLVATTEVVQWLVLA